MTIYIPMNRIIEYPTVMMTITATMDAGIPFLKKSDGSR